MAEHRDGSSAGTPPPGSGSYEEGEERLAAAAGAAIAGEDGWHARLSAGLRAGLEILAGDPLLARLLLVDSLASTRSDRIKYERSVERLAGALQPPPGLTGGEPISDEILRLQAHGLVSYLSGRVLNGEADRLPDDHGVLFEYLLAFSRSPS